MLRITPIERASHQVVLRLEGRVSGPWVKELSEACAQALSDGDTLVLNLAEVSFLDVAGVDLLTKLQSQAVRLVDCSMFVQEQLKAARSGSLETGRAGPLFSK